MEDKGIDEMSSLEDWNSLESFHRHALSLALHMEVPVESLWMSESWLQ